MTILRLPGAGQLDRATELATQEDSSVAATAARIFREKGFRGASLADVAESLGTDPRIALLLHRQQRRAVPRDRPGRR